MENQNAKHPADDQDIKQQTENEEKSEIKKQDDAGPSQIHDLPGSVPLRTASQIVKSGLSKSEHNIRQLQTNPTLNLTSLSFAQAQPINTLNPNNSNVPTVTQESQDTNNYSTFTDMKKFMASYFRGNESPVTMTEVQNTTALESVPSDRVPLPNTNCVTSAQTEDIHTVPSANEVIVTNLVAPAESKISKSESGNKKRNSVSSEKSGFLVAQRDSLSSIGSNVCRICMTRGRERLISPCNCKGSLANVHLTCLERWLNQVGRNHCELCGFRLCLFDDCVYSYVTTLTLPSYPAIRTPRYTVLQALRLWFGNPRNRSHLQSDCLIFWLLSTVTAGLLAVCIVGTQYFVIEGNKFGKRSGTARNEEGISHRITETAMDFFMAIVLCGYFVTVYLLCKDHYVMWNRWRQANVHVRLLLSRDTNPIPFVPRSEYNNIV